ncbi:MAG: hypothetical protein QG648_115 [Patescibacteria group bacterium]|nr:hypothetical protein [Patescibacteria group bacterium]
MNGFYLLNTLLTSNLKAFYLLLGWTLLWKGLALWQASQHRAKIWFVVLLLINTFGILDILYLFIFSKYVRLPKNKKTQDTNLTSAENKKETEIPASQNQQNKTQDVNS